MAFERGCGCYLREVRNVSPDQAAVTKIFGDEKDMKKNQSPSESIDTLALDLGEAFTVQEGFVSATTHRLETQKAVDFGNGESIATIESNLPSFEENPRVGYETKHWDALSKFYNDATKKYLGHN
ncbi:hypothetical protein BGX26_001878 [Mortierella sp. AD094]|nr:hypothetical protein BGX26_001878 [Mortierella sp. AD094]